MCRARNLADDDDPNLRQSLTAPPEFTPKSHIRETGPCRSTLQRHTSTHTSSTGGHPRTVMPHQSKQSSNRNHKSERLSNPHLGISSKRRFRERDLAQSLHAVECYGEAVERSILRSEHSGTARMPARREPRSTARSKRQRE